MGLSGKLLVLTLLFVMIAEVLIYVPSIANFRLNWLQDRLSAAYTAALVFGTAPSGEVPEPVARAVARTKTVMCAVAERVWPAAVASGPRATAPARTTRATAGTAVLRRRRARIGGPFRRTRTPAAQGCRPWHFE